MATVYYRSGLSMKVPQELAEAVCKFVEKHGAGVKGCITATDQDGKLHMIRVEDVIHIAP